MGKGGPRKGDDAKDGIKTAKQALITKAKNTLGLLLDSPGGGNGGNTGKKYVFKKRTSYSSLCIMRLIGTFIYPSN